MVENHFAKNSISRFITCPRVAVSTIKPELLKLNAALEQLDFPGICSFLQSSSDLETLIIDWYNHGSRVGKKK
ncbi:GTP-binding protein [Datura stramonium]|uniref:GTP-binding protein n=1 Tax=Datura stramonium TaxID=4076 RepID=A0ABS8WGM8_DATST|nr:GTP-binding protein [Datura stramonium]